MLLPLYDALLLRMALQWSKDRVTNLHVCRVYEVAKWWMLGMQVGPGRKNRHTCTDVVIHHDSPSLRISIPTYVTCIFPTRDRHRSLMPCAHSAGAYCTASSTRITLCRTRPVRHLLIVMEMRSRACQMAHRKFLHRPLSYSGTLRIFLLRTILLQPGSYTTSAPTVSLSSLACTLRG